GKNATVSGLDDAMLRVQYAPGRDRLRVRFGAGGGRREDRTEVAGAVCLVTGATSGIGRATALRLAQGGARVVALGRDQSALDQVAAATSGAAIRADLSKAEDVDRAAAEAVASMGRV